MEDNSSPSEAPAPVAPAPVVTVAESEAGYRSVISQARDFLKQHTRASAKEDKYEDKYDFCSYIVNSLAAYDEDAIHYGVSTSQNRFAALTPLIHAIVQLLSPCSRCRKACFRREAQCSRNIAHQGQYQRAQGCRQGAARTEGGQGGRRAGFQERAGELELSQTRHVGAWHVPACLRGSTPVVGGAAGQELPASQGFKEELKGWMMDSDCLSAMTLVVDGGG